MSHDIYCPSYQIVLNHFFCQNPGWKKIDDFYVAASYISPANTITIFYIITDNYLHKSNIYRYGINPATNCCLGGQPAFSNPANHLLRHAIIIMTADAAGGAENIDITIIYTLF